MKQPTTEPSTESPTLYPELNPSTFLEQKSKEEGVITLPSGLRYKVLESGEGGFHPAGDSQVVCHYAGTLIDGTEFDSSYSRGTPLTVSPNQVIPGWTEAMQLMVEGAKWELYIPSDLAYGDRGSPPVIPGGATLVFTIEMIEIQGGKVPVTSSMTFRTSDDTSAPTKQPTLKPTTVSMTRQLDS